MGTATPVAAPHLDSISIAEAGDDINVAQETQEPQPETVEFGPKRSRVRIFAIMAGLCAAVFIPALNQTVVGTAIPTISADLNSSTGYAWISAAHLLANAIASPIWSKCSDIWGRKVILLSALVLYFAYSIICAMATSMEMLIIGRAFQGTAGGGLIQIVYAVISDIFSMRERTLYLGLLQLVWATAGGLGPLIGGIFAEYVSWRWVFWINLPIAFVVFVLLFTFLDVHNPKTGIVEGIRAVDWLGILTLAAFMICLLLGLNFGGELAPWNSPLVICLLVFGIAMIPVFFFCESKARYPLVPFDLFKAASNIAVLVIGFMHDLTVFAVEFFLPLYFQSVKDASPLESGYRIIPVTLMQALVGIATGLIVHRTGRYLDVIWVGVALLTLGNGLYINLSVSSSLGSIIAFQIVAATGAGLLFQPPLIALQAMVPPSKTASATATLGLVRSLSTSVAIVLGQVIFANGMQSRQSSLLEQGLPQSLVERFSGSQAAAHTLIVGDIEDLGFRTAIKGAFADSLRGVWILCTCSAAFAIIASAFVSKQILSKEHVEHRTGLNNM